MLISASYINENLTNSQIFSGLLILICLKYDIFYTALGIGAYY